MNPFLLLVIWDWFIEKERALNEIKAELISLKLLLICYERLLYLSFSKAENESKLAQKKLFSLLAELISLKLLLIYYERLLYPSFRKAKK